MSSPLPASQLFTDDANGNRSSLTEDGTPYSYSNLINSNRLLSTTGPTAKTYTYDASGNVTSDGLQSEAPPKESLHFLPSESRGDVRLWPKAAPNFTQFEVV